jgi:hypothetical protein
LHTRQTWPSETPVLAEGQSVLLDVGIPAFECLLVLGHPELGTFLGDRSRHARLGSLRDVDAQRLGFGQQRLGQRDIGRLLGACARGFVMMEAFLDVAA